MHWLIRACQDRATDGDKGQLLRDRALATPVLYEVELLVRGRSARQRPKIALAGRTARRGERPWKCGP